MIHTFNYYESPKLPKYFAKVVELMRKADSVVFNNKKELQQFADRVKK